MTYYDRVESRYEALAEIQTITTKVIQEAQQTITKDRPQIQEATQIIVDMQKVTIELPMVHQSFYQFVQEKKKNSCL